MNQIIRLPDGIISVTQTGPAAVQAGLQELTDLIASAGFDIDRVFNRGLDETEVRDRFSAVGLVAPDEVVAFYHWHDGYNVDVPPSWPVPRVVLAPLRYVLARYADHDSVRGLRFEPDAPLIILENDRRGHAVVCDRPPEQPPTVLYFDEDNHVRSRQEPIGRSMCTWIESWIIGIREGVYSPVRTEEFGLQWQVDLDAARAYQQTLVLP